MVQGMPSLWGKVGYGRGLQQALPSWNWPSSSYVQPRAVQAHMALRVFPLTPPHGGIPAPSSLIGE